MTFISYAQNYEDVMLWRALKHVQGGFYIDVGAAWPDEHSVTKAFYLVGWRGVNIEPNPQFNQMLLKQRPEDKNLAVAVGDKAGHILMRFIKDTGLSTISSQIAEGYIASGWTIQEQEVELSTLAEICKCCKPSNQEIHFLKVDVEGSEEAVLRGNDWASYRPWIVVVEATLPMSQVESYASWEPILLAANYQFVYADGLNRFYVANEHAELRAAFKYPPNVFDGFVLSTQNETKSKAREAEAKAQEAEAKAQEAEAKAQEAEAKAQEAEVVLHQTNQQLNVIVNSRSWKLTAWLRSMNPERFFHKSMISLGHFFISHPQIVYKLKPIVKRYPKIWLALKNRMLFHNGKQFVNRYKTINFKNFNLLFNEGAINDPRGIGRVSRNLIGHLKKISEIQSKGGGAAIKGVVNDVYFYPSIHWCPRELPSPSVVVIHDVTPLIFPEIFPGVAKVWCEQYKPIAQKATKIISISYSSADDIAKYLEIPRDQISVVHNGVTELPIGSGVNINLPEKPYLVYVGSHDHHKNIDIVLQALQNRSLSDVSLVMVGDNKACQELVNNYGIQDRVHFVGKLSDPQVGYIISKALAMVFPSLYEGFGLPPMEAALLNVPSICSNRPAMSELLEGATVLADPLSSAEWVESILSLKNDAVLRNELIEKAKSKVNLYTWDEAAKCYLGIFNELIYKKASQDSNLL